MIVVKILFSLVIDIFFAKIVQLVMELEWEMNMLIFMKIDRE